MSAEAGKQEPAAQNQRAAAGPSVPAPVFPAPEAPPESGGEIELSVVMPCLNEADTLAACIRKAQLGLAECSFARGEFEAAQEYARRAERDGGKQPDILNFFGRIYTQRNQTRLAIQAYEESLAIDPNQESIQAALKKLQRE